LPDPAALGKAGLALTRVESACADCHHDPHDGRFVSRFSSGCRDCHGLDAFRPSNVDATAHDRFDYPLEGAHGAIPCVNCHEELKLPPSTIIGPAVKKRNPRAQGRIKR